MLTECWIGNEFMYELPEYKCFPIPRKLSSSTQGGGIVIFIKDTMSKSIEVVQNYADSVIWLKTNFPTGSCMYIACVYIPPANSKFYAKYDCNIFNDLENQISYYKNIGKVAIVGDFNARTADRNDYNESESTSEVVSNCDLFTYIPDAIMPDRTNLDPVVNEYGLKLISMCKSSGLRIQNGRWEKTHDFTFAGSRGRSVVDYLISQEGVLIEEFRIADFTTFSDHTPLEFSLRINHTTESGNQHRIQENFTAVRRFRWDDSQRDLARESLIVNLDKLRHCVPNTNDNSANSMNAYVHDFSLCLTDMMSPFFENYSAGLDTRLNSDSKPVHSSVTTVADKASLVHRRIEA